MSIRQFNLRPMLIHRSMFHTFLYHRLVLPIDVWPYVSGFVNVADNAIFAYCPQIVVYKCLHLTFRLSSSNFYLHFRFLSADCQCVTSITLRQRIYLNGSNSSYYQIGGFMSLETSAKPCSISNENSSLSTPAWSHVVQTYSASNGLRLYVNNVLVASRSAIYLVINAPLYIMLENILTGTGLCALGPVNPVPYKGNMDDFRVYSRELSAKDIDVISAFSFCLNL